MSALVEPPAARTTRSALVIERAVTILSGVSFSVAMAIARAPVRSAIRRRSACTAGTAAAPGSIMPSASVAHAIVLAVPITPHVPMGGASSLLIAAISSSPISPERYLPQKRRQSVHAPRRSPRQLPASIGPVYEHDRWNIGADRPHEQ